MSMDAPTMDVLRKQAIAMAMLWLTARDYDHEGGHAYFNVRARDLGLRDDVLPGKRIRVTIEAEPDTPGVVVAGTAGMAEVEYRSWFPVAPWHPASMDGWTLSDVLQFYKGALPACGSHQCIAGQRDGVLCADGECDRENGVRPDGVDLPDGGSNG